MVVLGTKEELFSDIMSGMNTLRKDKTLYDVRILVKGQEILAHKSVLAPVSDYFRSLFLGPFKTESATVEVDFTTIALDVESAEAVIEYLYTGTIDINDDNLEAILKLATFLLIKQLQNLCIKFMEQSPDLDSYLRYFILSVDYMVSEAEELVGKVVKSRFHDWFISRESTKLLSVCHLDKLVTSYDIFEHCSKIDTLLFLVDWVLNGQTEEHEALACEIIDPKVVEDELSGDDQESDNAPQSDDELKNNTSDVPQNDNVPQAGSETQSDNDSDPNKGPKNEGDTQTSHDVPPQKGSESPIKAKTQNENELQNTEKPETEQEDDVEEEKDDDSEEKERQNCHPISYNIPQKIQILHRKFDSVNGCIQLKDKCKEAIAELVSNDTDMMKQFDEGIADGNIEHLNQELASDSDFMDSIESEDLSQGTHVEQIKVGGSESRLGNLSKQIQKSVIKKTKEADEIHLSLKPNAAERLEVGNSVSKEESSIDQIKDAHEETDDTKDENENRFSVITQSTESGEIISQTETKTENSIEQTDDSRIIRCLSKETTEGC